ncbi:MAG: sugar phosphate nucleotidyltransferase, partial [Pseudomonadota bacterium]
MLLPVILSGGSGSRLWPLSRALYPKQLLPLVSDKTLLQDTVGRLAGWDRANSPLLICNEKHRFLVAEQLRQIGVTPASIILEPVGRNTAPAVAVAALFGLDDAMTKNQNSDSVLLVLPADHVIANVDAFQSAVKVGYEQACQGKLVTFGIVADVPETGYGYIKRGEAAGAHGAFSVAEFVEKPDEKTAEGYVQSGEYYWNSGMFMFQASTYLKELRKFNPDMLTATQGS